MQDQDVIVGIDLGTTNSEVALVDEGRPRILGKEEERILPSVVGLSADGRQWLPARTDFLVPVKAL